MTANMKAVACPDIISCTQYNNLINSGVEIGNPLYTNMSCGNNANNKTVTTTGQPAQTTQARIVAFVKTNYIYVIVGVLLFVFLIIIAITATYYNQN